jgi:hypothetical protein
MRISSAVSWVLATTSGLHATMAVPEEGCTSTGGVGAFPRFGKISLCAGTESLTVADISPPNEHSDRRNAEPEPVSILEISVLSSLLSNIIDNFL